MTSRQRRIQASILGWFAREGRDLPWRKRRTPYRVVVAEFMLQQTQVDRVIPYYRRFLKRFPSIRALARADRAEVLSLWSGLGYNRRAIYLHHLAQVVVENYRGQLPRSEDLLRALPGIGTYTARAILAFAYRQPVYATDVNIARIVYRASGSSETSLEKWIGPMKDPDAMHDALMDIGATRCLARSARCGECPLSSVCASAFTVSFTRTGSNVRKNRKNDIPMRLIRGAVLRQVIASAKGVTISRVKTAVITALAQNQGVGSQPITPTEVDQAITVLAREGFIMKKGKVLIPGSQNSSSLLE